jgi:hypothetical protein
MIVNVLLRFYIDHFPDATQGNNNTTSNEPDPEEEMGLAGAAAEDAEADYIRRITETSVVSGDGLLATLGPLLASVCSNPVKYTDPELRATASMALAKFMAVRWGSEKYTRVTVYIIGYINEILWIFLLICS